MSDRAQFVEAMGGHPHTFSHRTDEQGHEILWCDTEDVISDACEDFTRCENECVCNKVQVIIQDEYGYTEDTLTVADLPPDVLEAWEQNGRKNTDYTFADGGAWTVGWDLGL